MLHISITSKNYELPFGHIKRSTVHKYGNPITPTWPSFHIMPHANYVRVGLRDVSYTWSRHSAQWPFISCQTALHCWFKNPSFVYTKSSIFDRKAFHFRPKALTFLAQKALHTVHWPNISGQAALHFRPKSPSYLAKEARHIRLKSHPRVKTVHWPACERTFIVHWNPCANTR